MDISSIYSDHPIFIQVNGAESTEPNVCSSCQQTLRNALALRGNLNFITVVLTIGLYIVCSYNVTSRELASDRSFTNNIKEKSFILPNKTIGINKKRAGKQNYRTCLFRRTTTKPKSGNLRDWLELDDISGN